MSKALQQGLVPPLMGARVGEGRWFTTFKFNAYVICVSTSHDEADPLRTDVRALQKSMPRHATVLGLDIVADTWEAAAAFNAEVRTALATCSLEVSVLSADFATGARGLPMSSFSGLFQSELTIQAHKVRLRRTRCASGRMLARCLRLGVWRVRSRSRGCEERSRRWSRGRG